MADKRISQLTDRGTVANSDVVPIVVSGASTTNKATISSIQTFMQGNLDLGVTSVGLSMPSAFTVTGSPVTSSGNISVVGAGTVSQYIRGDGSLADFPQGVGGGGASVSYYLNLSVSQGSIGGIAYSQMSKVPVFGAGTDTAIASNGYIASFITDAGDPALLQIPAGNWNFETYFNANSNAGSPKFYIELYKVNSGGTATLIASNSATPEDISFGTTIHAYFSALAVPTTSLTLTDRLALRYYVLNSGRTITLHTENSHLCQIITTFTTGLTALNGLTAQVQNFATGSSGTDFTISSSTSTHTFNLPDASATNRGAVTTGTQTFAGAKTFNSDIIVNGITVGKGGASNGNNTAVGANALSSNTTGTLNTATGLSALQFNTAGNSNTANGANSLLANTTGGFNTAIGNQSLYSNTTGQANTAIGLNSLYFNSTGTYNTGIGSGAGYYIADGSTPNTTSDFSVYLGADTKASVDNAQNETVIGYNAIGSGSNTVTIGNSSVTDNYFTGTVRSTSLRLASAGTADPTFFRNTSGTNSITANANVLGFNGSNNIFVTTQSRGGFVLAFNNSTSNKTYTLQDADGTLAFTSQIPSVAGVYLPLAGGTLTGALRVENNAITQDGTRPIFTLQQSGTTKVFLGISSGSSDLVTGDSSGDAVFRKPASSGAFRFSVDGGTSSALTLASTGAATFSSSVTALGNVLIGKTSSTGGPLQISDGTNMFNVASDANGPYITAVNNANTVYKRMTYDATEHVFLISAGERVRVTSSGITFNGDTAAANALDDYEEGTWTPEMIGGGGTGTYSTRYGWYTKIGRQVTIVWDVSFQKSTISSTVGMSGLPFTVLADSSAFYPQGAVLLDNLSTTTNNITFQVANGSTQGDFIGGNGGTTSHTGLPASSLGSGTMICRGFATYYV